MEWAFELYRHHRHEGGGPLSGSWISRRQREILKSGCFMGVVRPGDGTLTWGCSRFPARRDLIGLSMTVVCRRVIPVSRIPLTAHRADIPSCASAPQNYRRADDRRDSYGSRRYRRRIDQDGRVVDVPRDGNSGSVRDSVIKTLDRGRSVYSIASRPVRPSAPLNLPKWIKSDNFGDVVGVGAGRNWARQFPNRLRIRRMTSIMVHSPPSPPPSRLATR